MKTSERIMELLRANGYVPISAPKRVYAGHWQRSAGAWSWFCDCENAILVGSQWNMTEVLKFETPVFGVERDFRQVAISPS